MWENIFPNIFTIPNGLQHITYYDFDNCYFLRSAMK